MVKMHVLFNFQPSIYFTVSFGSVCHYLPFLGMLKDLLLYSLGILRTGSRGSPQEILGLVLCDTAQPKKQKKNKKEKTRRNKEAFSQ